MIFNLFIEALNSVIGLLALYYALISYKAYRSSVNENGFKYFILTSLLIVLREASYFAEVAINLSVFRDLLTTLIVLTFLLGIAQINLGIRKTVAILNDRKLLKELSIK